MAEVAIARQVGVELEIFARAFFGNVGNKSEASAIDDVVATIKDGRPVGGRFEQVTERGYGSIVKIRSAKPEAIQWLVGIAPSLAEVLKPILGIGRIEQALVGAQGLAVGIEAPSVRLDLLDERHLADLFPR